MTIHKEGSTLIPVAFIISTAMAFTAHMYVEMTGLKIFLFVFAALISLVVLQFFRKPSRKIVLDGNTILCPADGKVVVIEEVEETEYFNDRRIQISVFMSPFNVHINWNPISGIVKYVKHHPGLFLVAWHPKSSTDNERTTIVVEHENKTEVLIRQIAGMLARRIVYYCEPDDKVEQGAEFGFIKFGSRVDIMLPLDAEIKVELNQNVVGTQTVLAKLA